MTTSYCVKIYIDSSELMSGFHRKQYTKLKKIQNSMPEITRQTGALIINMFMSKTEVPKECSKLKSPKKKFRRDCHRH